MLVTTVLNSLPTYTFWYKGLLKSKADRRSGQVYEKVMIVGMNNFDYFCRNFPQNMLFNSFDENFPEDYTDNDDWGSDSLSRKKYDTSQWKRDSEFAEAVKTAWNYRCAICGCDIAEVLQAAHEKGYEVRNTPSDDAKHGVCLCANHHLMYDRELLEIDLKNRKYRFSPVTKQTKWLKLFCEDFKGDIEYAPTSCN